MPGLSGDHRGNQLTGATATVLSDAPQNLDGYWWWHLDFDEGADGWVAQGNDQIAFISKVKTPAVEEPTFSPEELEAIEAGNCYLLERDYECFLEQAIDLAYRNDTSVETFLTLGTYKGQLGAFDEMLELLDYAGGDYMRFDVLRLALQKTTDENDTAAQLSFASQLPYPEDRHYVQGMVVSNLIDQKDFDKARDLILNAPTEELRLEWLSELASAYFRGGNVEQGLFILASLPSEEVEFITDYTVKSLVLVHVDEGNFTTAVDYARQFQFEDRTFLKIIRGLFEAGQDETAESLIAELDNPSDGYLVAAYSKAREGDIDAALAYREVVPESRKDSVDAALITAYGKRGKPRQSARNALTWRWRWPSATIG